MDELIVSVSGLRGIVGTSLTPEVAVRYAEAFLATLPPGGIVIGRDGRASGGMFADAIAAAVMAAGREVLDAGVAATPTVGVLVEEHQAAGGIQISASHNPPAVQRHDALFRRRPSAHRRSRPGGARTVSRASPTPHGGLPGWPQAG